MEDDRPRHTVPYVAHPGPFPSYRVVLTSILIAVGVAWAATRLSSFGYVFLVGMPVSIGFIVGYYAYTSLVVMPVIVAVVLVSALGVALMQSLAGLMCGGMALVAVVLPAMVGGVIGHLVRKRDLTRARLDIGAALIVLMPLGLWAEAKITPPHPSESIETSRILPMSPKEAWAAIAFYEDVPLERPTMLRIALPRPLGTSGRQDRAGEIVECLYENASIVKRMTEVVPGQLLAFEVVHQSGIEDRSVSLQHGAFHFEELPGRGTRVTLQSTYEPLLDGRSVWRPIEQMIGHSFHNHILDGMEGQESVPTPVDLNQRPSLGAALGGPK